MAYLSQVHLHKSCLTETNSKRRIERNMERKLMVLSHRTLHSPYAAMPGTPEPAAFLLLFNSHCLIFLSSISLIISLFHVNVWHLYYAVATSSSECSEILNFIKKKLEQFSDSSVAWSKQIKKLLLKRELTGKV